MEPEPTGAARPAAHVEAEGGLRLRILERLSRAHVAGDAPVPPRALAEAAHRIQRHRGDAPGLAGALAPLGLSVAAAGSRLLVTGPGWPAVVLVAGTSVVAAPHAAEIDAPMAALALAMTLGADAVLATDDEGGAGILAVGLAEAPPRPLLVVRGTQVVPGGEALLLEQPAGAEAAPWLAPVARALGERFTVTRGGGLDVAPLRAFPPGAGRAAPAALLWLSPRVRRALAGSDAAALLRPEFAALAATRGVPTLRGDAVAWIAAGRGAPDAQGLDAAERLVRTRDVALLRARAGAARVAVFLDEARGLAGIAVEAGGRRALALAGDRRELRVSAARPAEAEAALFAGARTLIAGGAP